MDYVNRHLDLMDMALRLARRGYGRTSPNPMVGAVLVRSGQVIGQGWHRQAGQAHAEIEAMRDALAAGHSLSGATLYVTLEPCSTTGRTPPCTDAIIRSGVAEVIVGAADPNPQHARAGYRILREAGIRVVEGVRAEQCTELNEAFNHWIVRRSPFVTIKAAMSLDGKIAATSGESKWISGPRSRAVGMRLRRGADAILVGVNTVLADNPRLTVRPERQPIGAGLRRIVLDAHARTPLDSQILSKTPAGLTTCVVSAQAPPERVARLAAHADVLVAPVQEGRIDLGWLLAKLGAQAIVSLLVEGGGQVNASFLMGGYAQRVVFFYAPMILGGGDAPLAVAGCGARTLQDAVRLRAFKWRMMGQDLWLTGLLRPPHAAGGSS